MTRSLKKGPFVDHHLLAKVEKAVGHQGQEADQDLVAPLDDPARFHRPDDRRAQRQAARAGLRHRPDGRPQARRIRADAHLQGSPGRQEGREEVRRQTMETSAIVRGVRLSADKGRLVADLIRGKKVDQALNILDVHAEEGRRHHQEGARVGDRERRAQRRRRHRRTEGQDDLRRAGRHAEAFLRARQGPRQPHQQAHVPHLRDRRQLRPRKTWDRKSIRPASACPVTRNWASRWYANNRNFATCWPRTSRFAST